MEGWETSSWVHSAACFSVWIIGSVVCNSVNLGVWKHSDLISSGYLK